ncbi:MAG: hypothetical protein GY928_02055 [Colwellia sp.]|nr:hypothetical protein [Colwellia sp.]
MKLETLEKGNELDKKIGLLKNELYLLKNQQERAENEVNSEIKLIFGYNDRACMSKSFFMDVAKIIESEYTKTLKDLETELEEL